jgi:hypothetical protein
VVLDAGQDQHLDPIQAVADYMHVAMDAFTVVLDVQILALVILIQIACVGDSVLGATLLANHGELVDVE